MRILFLLALTVTLVVGPSCDNNPPAGGPGGFTFPDRGGGAEARLDSAPPDLPPDLPRPDAPAPDAPVTTPPDGPVTVIPDLPQGPPDNSPTQVLDLVTGAPDGPVKPPKDSGVKPPKDGNVQPPKDGNVAPPKDGNVAPPKDGNVAPPKDAKVTPPKDSKVTKKKDSKVTKKKDSKVTPPKDQFVPPVQDTSTDICSNNCDCPQGKACKSGGCVKTTPPTYCCSKNSCPINKSCTFANGAYGFCAKAGKKCTQHCNCPQGDACLSGHCYSLFVKTYCCNKSGCPTGSPCYKLNGNKSYCP